MANATAIRFPEALKAEAKAYADALGISVNALCAMALRDYLDARKHPQRAPAPPSPAPVESPQSEPAPTVGRGRSAAPEQQAVSTKEERSIPRVGVNQPCPCGSGRKYKHCHGKA